MIVKKIIVFCAVVILGVSASLAVGEDPDYQHTGSPCFGISDSQIIFCENFDTYCTGGNMWNGYPPFPAACVDGVSTPDDIAYLTNWLKPFNCGILWMDKTLIVDEVSAWGFNRDYNPPFAMRYSGCFATDPATGASICSEEVPEGQPWNLSSSRHEMSMVDAIDYKWPGYGQVNGTDSAPLKLKYHLDHMTREDDIIWHRVGDATNAIFYVELCLDDDRAPTNHTIIDCGAAGYGTRAVYPVVCQQWQKQLIPQPGFLPMCPPLTTDTHASIAVGLLAILDANPCDLEHGRRPNMRHLAVFDGLMWHALESGYGIPGTDEFDPWDGGDFWIEVWLRTSTIYIKFVRELCCGGPDYRVDPCYDGYCTKTLEVNEVIIPRKYTGGFNKIAFGCGEGCELNGGSHECASAYECFTYGAYNDGWGWGHTWLDPLVLYDGVSCGPYTPPIPMVVSAVSVKTHGPAGDFGINVGKGEIESRVGGIEQLVVQFDRDVQLLSGDNSVAIDSGTISNVTLSASNEVTIEMAGTTNAEPLAITFPGVASAFDASYVCTDSVCALQLMGDAFADGVITSLDRVFVRDAMIKTVDATNFRIDVAPDGVFTALDRVKVRDAMTTGLSTTTCP